MWTGENTSFLHFQVVLSEAITTTLCTTTTTNPSITLPFLLPSPGKARLLLPPTPHPCPPHAPCPCPPQTHPYLHCTGHPRQNLRLASQSMPCHQECFCPNTLLPAPTDLACLSLRQGDHRYQTHCPQTQGDHRYQTHKLINRHSTPPASNRSVCISRDWVRSPSSNHPSCAMNIHQFQRNKNQFF